MNCSRNIVLWATLVPGILAIGAIWLVLDKRSLAEENERLRADLVRARQAPPARVVEPPPSPAPKSPEPPPPPADTKPKEPPTTPGSAQPLIARPEAGDVPALQAKAQDPAADPKQRLAALADLRMASPDGRTPEVVRSMIDLLRTSPDGEIRADICRQLSRVVSEDLKQQLLLTARADSHAKAR